MFLAKTKTHAAVRVCAACLRDSSTSNAFLVFRMIIKDRQCMTMMKSQFHKIADGVYRRRRVHEKGVEWLIAHSTVGARREMSGGDLAVWPTERTVLAGRLYRMTMIIRYSTQPRYPKTPRPTLYKEDFVMWLELMREESSKDPSGDTSWS